jgi:glycosyltransferase involved in cell wall biosynthesis
VYHPAPVPRLRVLLLAESCHPEWVSVPALAFKAVRAIAELADVTLVTHIRNREAISRVGCGRAKVDYVDTEAISRFFFRLGTFLRGGDAVAWTTHIALLYPAYLAFERKAWKQYRAELKAGSFDVVHRITPMTPTVPSPMASWSPVPFVIGPLNGGLRWPPGFQGELRREREYMTYVRNAYRHLPYHGSTYARASAIMAGFPHTIADLPASARPRIVDFPEIGVDLEIFHPPQVERPKGPLTFLFAGRLVPYKCCDVVVSAFAASQELRKHKLVVVGDGPERPMLTEMVEKNGLSECVQFLGWKNQAEVANLMREIDVFAFPSIRELGASVVIEAMACGCVPVVVDYGGPGGLVNEHSGIRVPLGSKAELVVHVTRALEELCADPEKVLRFRSAAIERAKTFYAWEVKARKTIEVYEWALGRRDSPPRFR